MAEDFETLASEHASSDTKLIAEVDCTDEDAGILCTLNNVEGFPTIKYGDPNALTDYNGGRDFDSMNEFVVDEVKLGCGPMKLELCTNKEKALIESIQKMSDADLDQEIAKVEEIINEADQTLEDGIAGLQERFDQMMEVHEAKVKKVQEETSYKLMQSILSMKKKEAGILEDDDDAMDDDAFDGEGDYDDGEMVEDEDEDEMDEEEDDEEED